MVLKSTYRMLMSSTNLEKLIQDEVIAFRGEVEAFLSESQMGVQYFGLKAARNPRLVQRLRDGQGVTLETIRKVRTFMDAARAELSARASNG